LQKIQGMVNYSKSMHGRANSEEDEDLIVNDVRVFIESSQNRQ
jgi:hypothetical protein